MILIFLLTGIAVIRVNIRGYDELAKLQTRLFRLVAILNLPIMFISYLFASLSGLETGSDVLLELGIFFMYEGIPLVLLIGSYWWLKVEVKKVNEGDAKVESDNKEGGETVTDDGSEGGSITFSKEESNTVGAGKGSSSSKRESSSISKEVDEG